MVTSIIIEIKNGLRGVTATEDGEMQLFQDEGMAEPS
jgi:hypothetical protein